MVSIFLIWFFKNLPTIFQVDWNILRSQWLSTRAPASSHLLVHLTLCLFGILFRPGQGLAAQNLLHSKLDSNSRSSWLILPSVGVCRQCVEVCSHIMTNNANTFSCADVPFVYLSGEVYLSFLTSCLSLFCKYFSLPMVCPVTFMSYPFFLNPQSG